MQISQHACIKVRITRILSEEEICETDNKPSPWFNDVFVPALRWSPASYSSWAQILWIWSCYGNREPTSFTATITGGSLFH